MADKEALKNLIRKLILDARSHSREESEKRTEDFLRPVFEAMGWKWLSKEVTPQKKVRWAGRTTRVDYAFRKSGELTNSFYIEVKRFSDMLDNPEHIKQALDYGKNSGTRWVVLTNFFRWRVFNSDFYHEPGHSELFEFELEHCLADEEKLDRLLKFSRDSGKQALDEYAKDHKKWKESESIEDLLTDHLLEARIELSKALKDQNYMLFNTTPDSEDVSVDACVQHILDRIIFCRMLEDNGTDQDFRLTEIKEIWKKDRRTQFYRDHLLPFWERMKKKYDSTIFDTHRIDGLSIKNEDFIPIIESFYVNKNGLAYRFEAIGTDVLGHAYENYLSYKVKETESRIVLQKGLYSRKQSGIYYTPEFLVDFLVTHTLGERLKKCRTPQEALNIRVLDPACGSGTFLVRAFQEFKYWFEEHERKNGIPGSGASWPNEVLERCLYGIDLDPRAVRLSMLNLFLQAIDAPKRLPRLNIIQRNSLVSDDEIREVNGHKPFKFEKDFPLVHEQGGFDIVLGNPPWEKWKPDSQEFFEEYEPGFKSLPKQEAKKRMEEILKRKPVRARWENKNNEYEIFSDYFRRDFEFQSAEVNGKQVSGDLDLYKIFTERFHQLLRPGGLAGIVVPSGIYTDLGAKGLRGMLFDHSQIRALYSFENRGHAIFPDVHASYKPVLLVFEKGGKTKSFPAAFFLHTADDLKKAEQNPTIIDIDFVKRSSPNSWSVLEIKTPQDYAIVGKMLMHPSLGQKVGGAWNVSMQSGFHMTNDSHLFQKGLFGIPMLEGKNIHQFTHKFAEAPTPRYKILEKDIETNIKLDKIYHKGYWMAYRLIGRSTDSRTFISTIIPPGYVCGHSIAIVKLPDLKHLCYLTGVMNSFVVDYFLRQKVSANVTMFNFLETPVPRLSAGKEFDFIVKKVAQLVCTTPEFSELKKLVGVEPLISESDRALARAQLDVMVAKVYGITKEELAHMLEAFPIVDKKQKELVLAEY